MARRISDIVAGFGAAVAAYATQVTAADSTRKLARALKALGDLLGDEGGITLDDSNGEAVELDGASFSLRATVLDSFNADLTAEHASLSKTATKVRAYLDDELIDGDDAEVASNALEAWDAVKGTRTNLSVVGGTARSGERVNPPDFDFPIFAECEECGKEIQTGARTGHTDWNSLRHFSQRHAQNVHGTGPFGSMVSGAWRNAKAAFENGATDAVIEGDGNTPGFIIRKMDKAEVAS